MTGRVSGKVVVVTGAASGLGEATARLMHAEGAAVLLTDIQDTRGQRVADELGDRARYLHCDVAAEPDVANAVEVAVREFGRLDCMFNNAGIVGTHGGIDEIPLDEYEFTMTVLLRSVFLGMKHAARVMKQQRSGVILSTTSIGGLQGGLGPHIYGAAKGAVISLTKNVAAELGAWSIRVNAIAPGKILTPMNAANLIGDPDAMDEARRLVAGQRRRRVRQRPDPGRRRRPDDRVARERRAGRARPVGQPARPGPRGGPQRHTSRGGPVSVMGAP
jgi:NAD(P)-dependent dehydrogenase (short-subunit alcohol dehydrogenase family)